MAGRHENWVQRLRQAQVARRWERVASDAARIGPAARDRLAGEAETLAAALDHARAALRRSRRTARAMPDQPPRTELALRHPAFRGETAAGLWTDGASPQPLGPGLTLFHDARDPVMGVRADRDTGRFCVDVFQFDGSFLSLVAEVEPELCTGLSARHVLSLTLAVRLERPCTVFARLNLRHGPNTDQIVAALSAADVAQGGGRLEFDLVDLRLEGRAVDHAWVDLIAADPAMNRIELADIVLSRRSRAEL